MDEIDLNERVQDLIDSALKQYVIKNYSESINSLKAALVIDRENPVILYNLGVNYCRMGLYKTAIQYFRLLLNLSFSFIESANVKKLFLYSLSCVGEYEEAESLAKEILSFYPNDMQAKQMLAYSYEKREQYKDAIAVYKEIIKKDPKNYSVYNSLAYVMALSNSDLKTALKYAKKAMNKKNMNAALLDTTGYILIKLGDFSRAEKFLLKASHLSPLTREIEEHLNELHRLRAERRDY